MISLYKSDQLAGLHCLFSLFQEGTRFINDLMGFGNIPEPPNYLIFLGADVEKIERR